MLLNLSVPIQISTKLVYLLTNRQICLQFDNVKWIYFQNGWRYWKYLVNLLVLSVEQEIYRFIDSSPNLTHRNIHYRYCLFISFIIRNHHRLFLSTFCQMNKNIKIPTLKLISISREKCSRVQPYFQKKLRKNLLFKIAFSKKKNGIPA